MSSDRQPRAPTATPKTILVIDDSETIRQQVASALEQAGFAVLTARDGVEGLERIERDAPAMVILDVNMPRMNGIELLESLDVRRTGLPVVLLTTEVQPSLMARARQAGARGWLVKPFNVGQLVETVRRAVI
ncbi:MAG TPA: response regulator [Polyangiaceae bacterium]|nr:response regulator [Polyangiaceae bacterium]